MIKILHLYYDLLNLYGEQGNILALKTLFKDQNIEITIDYKTIGDDIKLNSYDLVYIGCGSNENLLIALDDIQRLGKQFKKYIDDGKYVISTGNSYLLFGDKIDDSKALGIFDYYAASEKRIQGEVLYRYFGLDKNIIGFQNRQYIVNNKKNHLFKVLSGPADNFKTEFEGYHENNFFGTFTVGPLLIRNPHFTNMIINDILKKHGLKFHNDDNTILSKAYDAYIKNFYE